MPVTGNDQIWARAIRHPLTGLLVFAALVRLAFFLEVRHEPTFTVPLWDSAVFDEMARSVARGEGVGDPRAYFFGPLYAYLLGSIYFLTGSCAACAVLLQHGLGVLLAGLTYALARTWFGRRESLLGAAILGLTGVAIFYEGKLLMEVWVSALVLGAVLLLARATRSPLHGPTGERNDSVPVERFGTDTRPKSSARLRSASCFAGLLFGLAALGRPTVLLLTPLGFLAFLPPARRSAVGRRRGGLLLLMLFLVGLGLPPTLTLIRNYRTEGVWIPITSSGGFNFYLGNAREGIGGGRDAKVGVDSSWNGEDLAEAELGRQLDSAQLSRYWFRRTLDGIAEAPGWWLGHYANKVQTFLGGQDIPQIECYGLEKSRSRVLRWFSVGLPFLMATAVAGMGVALRRRRELLLLYGPLLLYVAGVAGFFITTRYRVVALPYLAVFSAVFLGAVWETVRTRSWNRLLILSAVGLAAALVTYPGRFPIDREKTLYALHLHDGFRLTRAQEFARAETAYLAAQKIQPDDYEGYLGLGITYREQGDLEGSLRQLEEATQRNADDADVPYQLGITLHRMRLYEGAERAARQSLELSPRRALTHTYLALTLAAQARYGEARAEFDRSLELDAGEPFTHNNLGALLGLQGDAAAARQSFLRAVELDPGYTPARRNLAQSYLEAGELDLAVRELERVMADDPEDEAARALLRSVRPGRPAR